MMGCFCRFGLISLLFFFISLFPFSSFADSSLVGVCGMQGPQSKFGKSVVSLLDYTTSRAYFVMSNSNPTPSNPSGNGEIYIFDSTLPINAYTIQSPQITFMGPAGGNNFGNGLLNVGDIDSDGVEDIAVSDGTSLYLLSGSGIIGSQPFSNALIGTLAPTVVAGSDLGSSMALLDPAQVIFAVNDPAAMGSRIHIIQASATGLSEIANIDLFYASGLVGANAGIVIKAGDIDGDAIKDLVVGSPNEATLVPAPFGPLTSVGAIAVLDGNSLLTQTPSLLAPIYFPSQPEQDEGFGSSIAVSESFDLSSFGLSTSESVIAVGAPNRGNPNTSTPETGGIELLRYDSVSGNISLISSFAANVASQSYFG
ncbi:MAG: hypothetical protein D6808_05120, partial [Candidatus Dadabacteria bacterium]